MKTKKKCRRLASRKEHLTFGLAEVELSSNDLLRVNGARSKGGAYMAGPSAAAK